MTNHFLPKFSVTLIAIATILFSTELLFAQGEDFFAKPDELTGKQKLAREYCQEGRESQRIGNSSEALSFYQKAIAVDPSYALAYNDLGVIYDELGSPAQAEENYLRAIRIDPDCLSAYDNLVLFYEGQGNFKRAGFYRAKAEEITASLEALAEPVSSDQPEEKPLSLTKETAVDRSVFNKNNQTPSQRSFQKAKKSFKSGDLATAIKEAMDAQCLDEDNKEIEAFIEKVETIALTR